MRFIDQGILEATLCLLLASALAFAQEPAAPALKTAVFGRVVDARGRPVAGAAVALHVVLGRDVVPASIVDPFESFRIATASALSTTDAKGNFRFEVEDADALTVLSVDAGELGRHGIDLHDAEGRPSASERDLGTRELDRVRWLTGRLVDDASGSPLAGAVVATRTEDFWSTSIEVEGLLAGEGLLFVQPRGHKVWIPPQAALDALRSGAVVVASFLESEMTSDSDGRFRLAIPVSRGGSRSVRIEAAGYTRTSASLEHEAGEHDVEVGTLRVRAARPARVRILDERRRPVAGAEVRWGHRPEPATGTNVVDATDAEDDEVRIATLRLSPPLRADGQGELELGLPATRATFLAARADASHDWSVHPLLGGGTPYEIVLPAPRTIELWIFDPSGAPLDAEVAIVRTPTLRRFGADDDLLMRLAPEVLTLPAERVGPGRVRIGGFGPGSHRAFVRASGRALALLDFDATRAHRRPLRTTLWPHHERAVRVVLGTDGETVPLAGARVSWTSKPWFRNTAPVRGRTPTDGEGRFSAQIAEGDGLALEIEHATLALRKVEVGPAPGEALVVLEPAGAVEGYLRRSGGHHAGLYSLRLATVDGDAGDPLYENAVGPDYGFRFESVLAGEYDLTVSRVVLEIGQPLDVVPDDDSLRTRLVVEPGRTARVDVDIEALWPAPGPTRARILGVVRGSGEGGLDVWIEPFTGTGDDDEPRIEPVGLGGEFDLGLVVAPGRYVLTVSADIEEKTYVKLEKRVIEVSGGREEYLEIDLELGGPLRGVVRDAETKQPIAGAELRLCERRPSDPADDDSWRSTHSFVTRDDGSFDLHTLRSGPYCLRLVADRRPVRYLALDVEEGRPLDLGVIELARGPRISAALLPARAEAVRLRFDFVEPPAITPPPLYMSSHAAILSFAPGETSFSTTVLAPGRYLVRLESATKERLPFRPLEIEVPEMGIQGLELRFERP